MLRATTVVRKLAVKPDRVADTVTLTHADRRARLGTLKGEGGLKFLLALDKATALDDGDALKLEDGRLVQVRAAAEKLLEVRAENPLRLMRALWHIGNSHAPVEIAQDAIYIADDHALAELVRGQGCSVRPVTRPFRPERGAGAHAGHAHGHDEHGHDHGHHDHGHAHELDHGGCGCGHAHHGHHHHAHDHHGHDDHGHHGHGHQHDKAHRHE